MAKKSDKYAGMADMFAQLDIDQQIAQKTKEFNTASAAIHAEIEMLENSMNKYDNGMGDAEDRNEINFLNNKLRLLEQNFKQEIAQLKSK